MVQNFITVNPAVYGMYMSLANILRYERIEMPIFGTAETHLGEYKTTQKYLQVRKISPCESFVEY